tara:strand:- start:61 stop:471 length:411 start_codon:yes stop_codon:yes gene_type:complete
MINKNLKNFKRNYSHQSGVSISMINGKKEEKGFIEENMNGDTTNRMIFKGKKKKKATKQQIKKIKKEMDSGIFNSIGSKMGREQFPLETRILHLFPIFRHNFTMKKNKLENIKTVNKKRRKKTLKKRKKKKNKKNK